MAQLVQTVKAHSQVSASARRYQQAFISRRLVVEVAYIVKAETAREVVGVAEAILAVVALQQHSHLPLPP